MPQSLRTFIALEIASMVRDRAGQLIKELQTAGCDIKWVEPHNLHWSLQFLGDLPTKELPQLCDALNRATADLPSFEIECRGAGAFPDVKRPRTVWLGVGRGEDRMIELHDHIADELVEVGFRKEARRFRPHLTLGRLRRVDRGIEELGEIIQRNHDFDAGLMIVSEVVVFSSELARSGPTYEPLATVELRG